MATSAKIRFHLATLQEQALKIADHKVALAQAAYSRVGSEADFERRLDEWEADIRAFVRRLARNLPKMSRAELADVKVPKKPEERSWDRREKRRELESAQMLRQTILTKANALVADEDGTISLTPNQLSEFFGL